MGTHARYCYKADCQDRVVSLDVVSRKQFAIGIREAPFVSFVIFRTGSLAVIADGKVQRASANGTRAELDTGPGLEPGSLALAPNGRLYWAKGGVAQSAPLDPVAAPARERPEPAFGGSRRVTPKGSRTLGSGSRLRVYESATPFDETTAEVVACSLRTGRRTVKVIDEYDELEHVRVAGWLVATAVRGCLKDVCGAGRIETVDVRSGAIRAVSGGQGGYDRFRTTDGSFSATARSPGSWSATARAR